MQSHLAAEITCVCWVTEYSSSADGADIPVKIRKSPNQVISDKPSGAHRSNLIAKTRLVYVRQRMTTYTTEFTSMCITERLRLHLSSQVVNSMMRVVLVMARCILGRVVAQVQNEVATHGKFDVRKWWYAERSKLRAIRFRDGGSK